MIIFNIICSLAFCYFAYLNLNDPDAWLWVSIYLYAAGICGLSVFGKHVVLLDLIGITGYLLYALILFFIRDGVWDWIVRYHMGNIMETMKADKRWIEQTREFFGLLIITAALAINFFVYR
ncbi:MAG TPA: transmembrane 220 family protein [Chitinophagaceae bacterium]|nr:transmembrane 220 family protein [Chitinophagaceae bacterium]